MEERESVCMCVSHTETSAVLSRENMKTWRKRVTNPPLDYLGNSSPLIDSFFSFQGRWECFIYKSSTGIVSTKEEKKGKYESILPATDRAASEKGCSWLK